MNFGDFHHNRRPTMNMHGNLEDEKEVIHSYHIHGAHWKYMS